MARIHAKIGAKIALLAVCPVVAALAAVGAIFVYQQGRLARTMDAVVTGQSHSEAAKIAQGVYLQCVGVEAHNQRELDHGLEVARGLLRQAGGIRLGSETAEWSAINQFTHEAVPVVLPKMMVGPSELGRILSASEPAPIVDETRRLTDVYCTVFQRMDEAGDMLRVCTSVLNEDGTRAVGTFVPVRKPDGSENPVVATVLRGETYRGRAFVVNDWHTAAYEPIRDAEHGRVIGMLYVGIAMRRSTRELHDTITKLVVGKTGYIFVLGATGESRGRYIISAQDKRNGEDLWESKDADGRLFIQSIVAKGQNSRDGAISFETYSWQNGGESRPRTKFAAIVGFAPWDWVIGASTYDDDFADLRAELDGASHQMLSRMSVVAAVSTVLALIVGIVLARAISRPVTRAIDELTDSSGQIAEAANQVASASQALAEGSSRQSASLEETSSSIEEMSSLTKRNAENAASAKSLASEACSVADVGAADMVEMGAAMVAIKASSSEIAQIIKTIDEIAFQTNILALNAAVEAARAGEAGTGFAVVAEEVRNLAHRSAQAAHETAAKIEGAISKTGQGVAITGRVERHLAEIIEKVRRVNALMAEVANANKEQSMGIAQISAAVLEMDKAVQGNAASAEQSASASEELNGQASALRDSIVGLRELVEGAGR